MTFNDLIHRAKNIFLVTLFAYSCTQCNFFLPKKKQGSSSVQPEKKSLPFHLSLVQQVRWVGPGHDEDIKKLYNLISANELEALPDDHELTARSRFWADKMDVLMRAKYPQLDEANVPKPRIFVAADRDANAQSVSLPVCLDNVSISWGGQNTDRQLMEPLAFLSADGRVDTTKVVMPSGVLVDASEICSHQEIPASELNFLVGEILNKNYDQCSYSVNDKGNQNFEILANDQCQISEIIAKSHGANKVMIALTSDQIILNTGLFVGMQSEAEVVGVIAHELGHFYFGHSFTPDVNYFQTYFLTAPFLPVPLQDKNLKSFGEDLRKTMLKMDLLASQVEYLTTQIPEGILAEVPGQKYHTGVLQLINPQIVWNLKEMGCSESDSSCKDICTHLVSDWYYFKEHYQRKQMLARLSKLDQDKYLYIENELYACASAVRLDESAASKEFKEVVTHAFMGPKFDFGSFKASKYFTPQMLDEAADFGAFLTQFSAQIAKKYLPYSEESVTEFNQMESYYYELADEEAKYNRIFDDLEKKGNRDLIGQYTSEQEADIFAVEILAGLELDAKSMAQSSLSLLADDIKLLSAEEQQKIGKDLSTINLNYEYCQELQSNGWKDAQNNPVIIPIGTYESHHGGCFRTHILDKYADSFSVNGESAATKVADHDTWNRMKALAVMATQGKSETSTASSLMVSSNFEKRFLRRCQR